MLNKAARTQSNIIKAGGREWKPLETSGRCCRVIAISSGKGGVGKTSLVVNLAITLSDMGQRVVVFDADLGLANVEVLMGITPPSTLFDCIYGDKRIEDIIVPGPRGVKVVSGGSGFLELANLDSSRREKVIDSLGYFDQEADFVLIDTGAGISKNVLGFVAAASEVIVVVTPDPTSLTDAYSLIKILSVFKVHSEVMMVINRASDEKEAHSTATHMEKVVSQFLQIKLINAGWIPEDRAVSRAVKRQEPFAMFSPNSIPARSVKMLARYIITGIPATGAGTIPGEGARGFVGRLMRLFG